MQLVTGVTAWLRAVVVARLRLCSSGSGLAHSVLILQVVPQDLIPVAVPVVVVYLLQPP